MASNLKCTLLDSVVELKKLADEHLVSSKSFPNNLHVTC